MAFFFEPRRMRETTRAITEAFPIQSPKTTPGLKNMFRALAALTVEKVPRFGDHLGKADWELLCQRYRETSDAKTLIALAVTLAYRGDRRCTDILCLGFHQLPNPEEIRFLEEARDRYNLSETLFEDIPWVGAYLRRTASVNLVGFLCRAFRKDKLSFAGLMGEVKGETPLLDGFLDAVFAAGGDSLAGIPEERATARAIRYLEEGRDRRLTHYLAHYPESGWKPIFLEHLYLVKGPPDPRAGTFYRGLDKGRIWAIREKSFPPRLNESGLAPIRLELWRRWLHRCRDCRWDGRALHLWIEEIRVEEQPEATHVFRSNQLVETLAFEGEWTQRVEALLGDLLPWGHRA